MLANGELWKRMIYFISENYLMGCSHNDDGPAESDTGMGILKNHAYGVLDCKEPINGLRMVCVRNPWGRLEWTGRFSDGSSDWTPELVAKLNVKFEDDGTFWMCFEDFIAQYNNLMVLRLLNDEFGKVWDKSSFYGDWKKPNSGGCLNFPTWHDNPQYLITVKDRSKVFLVLSQPDVRIKWEDDYTIGIGFYIMKTKDGSVRKVMYDKSEMVAKATFTPTRDIAADAELLPGVEYIISVATFEANQECRYWLDIYSEEPHSCHQIPNDLGPYVSGEWRGGSAGGCYNHTTWVNNPKFCLTYNGPPPTGSTKVLILLRQEDRPTKYFVGMYSGKYAGRLPTRNEIEKISTCINSREVSLELVIPPNAWPQYIMPVTFEPNQVGSFEMWAYCTTPVKWTQF